MTVVLFFAVPVNDYTLLVEHVPTLEAAFDAGQAYTIPAPWAGTTEPDFLGAAIVPEENMTAFDSNHTFEVLTQANAA